MSRAYSRPITILKTDEETEMYKPLFHLHAYVNKSSDDNEYLQGGAIQAQRRLVFEVRYFKQLEKISFNTQLYRIEFEGVQYNVTSYDDYLLQHRTVKLLGESVI